MNAQDEIDRLVLALKRELKARGMTYQQLGAAIGLSEASVKRLFASRRFTLERLLQISHLLGFSLAELAQQASAQQQRLHLLSEAQETELVSDIRLLLVAVLVLNQWPIPDIVASYQLSAPEVIQQLARLDRLRLIELLPGNRVRLNVARDFDWRADGPIRRFFQQQGLGDFLSSRFSAEEQTLAFSHGMLTDAAIASLQTELRELRRRFAALHEESLAAPRTRRHGCGLLLALREWELPAFRALKRQG
jgi:transcriptional regulator with XRE-family HTH domain